MEGGREREREGGEGERERKGERVNNHFIVFSN
jgi:hypothetical protein